MQRRVVQRWVQTVQRRRKEREREEEMVRFVNRIIIVCILDKDRKRLMQQKDEMVEGLRDRMKSRCFH